MKSVNDYVGAGCERLIQPAPRSVPAPWPPSSLHAPLRSIVFLPRPLTAPLHPIFGLLRSRSAYMLWSAS